MNKLIPLPAKSFKRRHQDRAGVLAIFFLLVLWSLGAVQASAQAKEIWLNFQSEDTLIRARMPYGYESKNEILQISPTEAAAAGEATGRFDFRPDINEVKIYILRYDQTFGLPFNFEDEIREILALEFGQIKKYYARFGGKVESQKRGVFKTYPLGELIVNYNDEILGPQAVRAALVFANQTKIMQVAIGPPSSVTGFKTEDFFENVSFAPNFIPRREPLEKAWRSMESPSSIFTAIVPRKSDLFMPNEPTVKKGDRTDYMSFVFFDPARKQKMQFNVYGYVFKEGTNLTYPDVQSVLRSNHVLKRRAQDSDLVYNKTVLQKNGVMSTEFLGSPSPSEPYMDSVRLEAVFKGNIMIVKEVFGSLELLRGNMTETLLAAVLFHPESYKP